MAKSKKSMRDIVLETYQLLYEVSEPKLDFMHYLETTCEYQTRDGKRVTEDHHLTEEERVGRRYRYYIDFENHFIGRDVMARIVDEQKKKYKLKGIDAKCFNTTIYLGCAPKFIEDRDSND